MERIDLHTKCIKIMEMISKANSRNANFIDFYGKQIILPSTESFLFRSKEETELRIKHYENVIDRLFKYYNSTVKQLLL